MSKIATPQDKEFLKMKRYVQKRFPGAHTIMTNEGTYKVLNGYGYSVASPELMLAPALTVRRAWEHAKYAAWFTNMIRKSNAAFSDEKIYKKMLKD